MLKYAPPTPPKCIPSPLSQFIARLASYSALSTPKRECSFVCTGGSSTVQALLGVLIESVSRAVVFVVFFLPYC